MKCALVILIVGVVLVKDALSSSAEANSVPLLRKFSRNKGDASTEVESRGLFSIGKPIKRPTSANVIFITAPSGPSGPSDPSDSEESVPSTPSSSEPSWPSWPSWPYWPIHTTRKPSTTTTTTTTTTTPKPATNPPHLPTGDYPHYLPFPPPLLLPIPGWTGNPPPPFIHPSYQHRPQQQWPQWPQPPSWPSSQPTTDDQIPSAPGTPTLATDDEIVIRGDGQDKDKDKDENQGGLLWVPLQQDFTENGLSPTILATLSGAKRKPQGSKGPKPNKRRPVQPSPFGGNNRRPRPSRGPAPVKKLIVESPELPDNRRKPKPSRKPKPKPKPSAKPTEVVATPEEAAAAEVPSEVPIPTMPSAVSSTESTVRKKTPTKPPPSGKPTPVVVESVSDAEMKKDPQPAPKPEATSVSEESDEQSVQVVAAKQETEDDDSSESLGPEEDLIVVQRQGTPTDEQRAESGQIPPWQLLKLPRDADWELGPQQRDASPKYVFHG